MTASAGFDASRARLQGPDLFPRFRTSSARPLPASRLPGNTPLIEFERGGQVRALLLREMAYHHVAQGELAGEPYVVTF